MNKLISFFILLIVFSNCSTQRQSTESVFNFSNENPMSISMVEILANPKKYDGKVVEIEGFLSLEHEGQAIYLNEDDYEFFNRKNGIYVIADISPEVKKECNLKHVRIIGKFQLELHTAKTDWNGWLITNHIFRKLSRDEMKNE